MKEKNKNESKAPILIVISTIILIIFTIILLSNRIPNFATWNLSVKYTCGAKNDYRIAYYLLLVDILLLFGLTSFIKKVPKKSISTFISIIYCVFTLIFAGNVLLPVLMKNATDGCEGIFYGRLEDGTITSVECSKCNEIECVCTYTYNDEKRTNIIYGSNDILRERGLIK